MMAHQPLPREFYQRKPVTVAQEILGKFLVRTIGMHILSGMITEVEAYLGPDDPASHSFVGKTKRNTSLFGPAGHAYIHRMHGWHLLDIVTEFPDQPSSLLIRRIEPQEGIKTMMKLRNTRLVENIADGPGKVCQALDIEYELDGVDMTNRKAGLYIVDSERQVKSRIFETPRIGITKGEDSLLRFVLQK